MLSLEGKEELTSQVYNTVIHSVTELWTMFFSSKENELPQLPREVKKKEMTYI